MRSCSLSAIDKGNEKKIPNNEKPPIKNFLEWRTTILVAI
jgi:hypothetical protein